MLITNESTVQDMMFQIDAKVTSERNIFFCKGKGWHLEKELKDKVGSFYKWNC